MADTATPSAPSPAAPPATAPVNAPLRPVSTRTAERRRRAYPTLGDLRNGAKRRIPAFAFDYLDGNANDEHGFRRNIAALAAIEMIPRYSAEVDNISFETELFGRRYAAPFGVAPMGSPGLIWPGAERELAQEAQRRNVPYVLASPTNATIEEIAPLAPDVFWFQLYRFPRNDNAMTDDLMRRARDAGAHVLVMTVDTPLGLKRPRDMRNGLSIRTPFRFGPWEIYQLLTSPWWVARVLERGIPQLGNFAPYAGAKPDRHATAQVMARENGGSHRWEEIARMRDLWKKPLVLKGILHPADAERAASLGIDGVVVSNHGGRNFDGAPATIDMLPGVVSAVGSKMTVLFDSGVRCGLDIVRALALGANAVLVGRPFLYSLAAIGDDGPRYVIDMLLEELRGEFSHLGATAVADIARAELRHPGAWRFASSSSHTGPS
ncbi:MAG TPA: alpha-hydroxy acid oxidase [Xanthobacteraceae bacterium]|nr:alpha-hydroxy acid oxidase [Xanthobacteraceae bacterium]